MGPVTGPDGAPDGWDATGDDESPDDAPAPGGPDGVPPDLALPAGPDAVSGLRDGLADDAPQPRAVPATAIRSAPTTTATARGRRFTGGILTCRLPTTWRSRSRPERCLRSRALAASGTKNAPSGRADGA